MTTTVDWSELQDDLIGEIAKNIGIVEDFVSFSRVCPSWRLAAVKENWVAAGPQLPWLALAEKYEKQGCNRRGFFNFKRNKRYELDLPQLGLSRSWGSSLGWIVTVTLNLEVHMFNPLSGLKLKLPHLKTLNLPEVNNSDQWFMKAFVYQRNKHFFVGFSYGVAGFFRFAIARPGDESWSQVEGDPRIRILDVVYFNGQLIAVSYDGSLELCEFDWIHDPKFVTIVPPNHLQYRSPDYQCLNYLVESAGELLMVVRWVEESGDTDIECGYNTLGFDIYELNFKKKEWRKLTSLGDTALFLGDSDSLSLSSTDVGCKGNAIYFTDDTYKFWDFKENEFVGHDKGIFSLEDKSFHPLADNLAWDDVRSTLSCLVWLIPSLF